MSGGQVNDADIIAYTCTSAVSYAGLIVKGPTAAATVDLCGAASTDITVNEPIGYTFTNTKDPVTGVATAAMKVGIVAFIPGQIAEGLVGATHTAIAVGTKLTTAAAGYIAPKSGACWVIGVAETALAENTAGYVKYRVYKYWASA